MSRYFLQSLLVFNHLVKRGHIHLGMAGLILLCSGCWDEVPYDPSQPESTNNQVTQSPSDQQEAPTAEEPEKEVVQPTTPEPETPPSEITQTDPAIPVTNEPPAAEPANPDLQSDSNPPQPEEPDSTSPSATPTISEMAIEDKPAPAIIPPVITDEKPKEKGPGVSDEAETILSTEVQPIDTQDEPPLIEEDLSWLDAPSSPEPESEKETNEEPPAATEAETETLPNTDQPQPAEEPTTEAIPEPTEEPNIEADQSTRNALAVWQMASKWSLAAAYFAKGVSPERYAETLEQSQYAAKLLDVNLPDFSDLATEEKRQAKVAMFLLDEASPLLGESLAKSQSSEHAALAKLAVQSHSLLLVYTPRNEKLTPIVSALRTSAQESAIPDDFWLPLVQLLEQRASYQEVKQAIFQLHQDVASHFSEILAD